VPGVEASTATPNNPMTNLTPETNDSFNSAEFRLQKDGTFRISIIGLARWIGVDDSGLGKHLRSASDENPSNLAKTLLAQGFSPSDIAAWGSTGGIPETAAPFIMEYFAYESRSQSPQARAALLAFSRVGVNAYLKDKLGLIPVPKENISIGPEKSLDILERSVNLLERIGGFDDRDRIQFSDMIRNTAARASGGFLLPPGSDFMAVTDLLLECGASATEASRLASGLGREIKRLYRDEFQADPSQRTQSVNGRPTKVSNYPESWLRQQAEFVKNWIQDRISQ